MLTKQSIFYQFSAKIEYELCWSIAKEVCNPKDFVIKDKKMFNDVPFSYIGNNI